MARTHAAGTINTNSGAVFGKGGEQFTEAQLYPHGRPQPRPAQPVATPVTPTRGATELHPHGQPTVVHMDDGVIVTPTKAVEYEFFLDSDTVGRNMDAWQLFHVLNAYFAKTLGQPIRLVVSESEARNGINAKADDGSDVIVRLSADLRFHMRRREVQKPPVGEEAWDAPDAADGAAA